MANKVLPDMVGMVAKNMAKTLAFYRLLELPVPEGQEGEPYVEVITENGYRLSWNSLAMVKEIDGGEWVEPQGSRMGLAFKCESPAGVDETFRRLTEAGHPARKEPWDAFWGQR